MYDEGEDDNQIRTLFKHYEIYNIHRQYLNMKDYCV